MSEGSWDTILRRAYLSGRCGNGFQRDGGRLTHLVPEAKERPLGARALCGAKPGRTSGVGWTVVTERSSEWGHTRMCGRCSKRGGLQP